MLSSLLPLSLALLLCLFLFEPVTLRIRQTKSVTLGIHLALFALLLTPSRTQGATRTGEVKKKKSTGRVGNAVLPTLSAGGYALRRYADRITLRIFTLAPKNDSLSPDREALATGGYALLLSLLLPLLFSLCEHVTADSDCALPSEGDCHLDIACSISLFDLLLLGISFLRTKRKFSKKKKRKNTAV